MRAKDVMNKEPYILYGEDTILNASKFMKTERTRNLPVVDKSNKLIGLITLREIIEGLARSADKALVKDAMVKEVKTIEPDTPLKGAIQVMLLNKFGCLPVVDKKRKLIGVITETDLLKALYDTTAMPSDFYNSK